MADPDIATDRVIARLMQEARPVRRLRPPLLRAALWLAAFAAGAAAAIMLFANMAVFHRRMVDPATAVELFGTLLTGLFAVIAAFEMSVPGRPRFWALLPAPALAIWLAGAGAGCWQSWFLHGGNGWAIGESWSCFAFIVGFGLPIAGALMWSLRAASPIDPLPVALLGALGASALAAFLLQFFHPFDITFMDLSVHAVAVLIVICVVTWRARPILGR